MNRLASEFRAALLACDRKALFISLQDFPAGACGDASYLLARYLKEKGCGEFDYVAGVRWPNFCSHAWLEKDGIIVDITADQFEEIEDEVLVTFDNYWHSQFEGNDRHIADFERWGGFIAYNLRSSYELIIKQIVKRR